MIISPAKSLDFSKIIPEISISTPFFLSESSKINSILKKKSPSQLSNLMNISEKLSNLNWTRNQEFKLPFNLKNSRPAIYTFDGDVYSGIEVESILKDNIELIQKKLLIISGLYGILKPFDLIQPYRLEMGTKLEVGNHKNLYSFWKEKISKFLNDELFNETYLLNLASNEYFSVIDPKSISTDIITPQFKDFKNGKLKMISFYAKKARGLMVRYVIDNKIESLEGIKSFSYGGYSYSDSETEDIYNPVFTR